MKISSAEEYALRALVCLAKGFEANKSYSLTEIAELEKLPLPFLEQLFRSLKKQALVTSKRGVNGGYVLSRPPAEISALEAIEAVSGPVKLLDCEHGKFCNGQVCAVSPLWGKLTANVRNTLGSTYLGDLI
jgi:Rrf2 family transcriptional regulator, cysteine metabolism repressor